MRTDAIFLQYDERIIKEASPIADLWCGSAIPKRSGYFRRVDGNLKTGGTAAGGLRDIIYGNTYDLNISSPCAEKFAQREFKRVYFRTLPRISCAALREVVASAAFCIECTRSLAADFSCGNLLLYRRSATCRTGSAICVVQLQFRRQGYFMTTGAACRLSGFGVLVGSEGLPAIDVVAAPFAITGSEGNRCENRGKDKGETEHRDKLFHGKYSFHGFVFDVPETVCFFRFRVTLLRRLFTAPYYCVI